MLMPLGMTVAPAAAHHRTAAAMPMEHCPEPAPSHDTKSGFVECTMACSAALPAVGSPVPMRPLILCGPVESSLSNRLQGLHPDTATPPPKRS
ncbi:MAG TPA: hypothetical protein VJ597_07615, partial [Sphingomicrobium sp.]|nr:hypothetical protein [Sphingomicrobium sp.]